jgi:hypothetical protein
MNITLSLGQENGLQAPSLLISGPLLDVSRFLESISFEIKQLKFKTSNMPQLDTQSYSHTSHGDPTGKTKETITSFLGRDGQADTTVHEIINPAVVNEHIQRSQHEERQKIIDREVHQDHHHISIQPVRDQEILPETHENNIAPVEHHEIKHGNEKHVAERLAAERNQFHNTRDVAETQITTSNAPTVTGEHIHHRKPIRRLEPTEYHANNYRRP